ncbi:trigger factor [Bacteroidia bacterium]|nr:trigger factor [Bacteroidia bacterium]
MKIVREEQADLTSLLKVTVEQADYSAAVDKTLREYRQKASVPGFRPGMVPMGIIEKMYRKSVTAEQAYRAATDACQKYFEDNKIDYLGDLLPGDAQQPLDFDSGVEHEFVFEFASSPEVGFALSTKDKLTRYNIKVDKKMEDSYRANFLRKFGRLVDVDTVESEDALNVTLDNASMNIAEAYVGLISMDEQGRKPFLGKKVGDKMEVDVNELYKNPAQRAATLQVKEEELGGIDPKMELTITKIRRFAEPEMNDDFFRMAFPEGDVTDQAGLKKYLLGQIAAELERETGYLFAADMRAFLLGKIDLRMPVEFLKKWLYVINENRFSPEEIERDFPPFLEMMKWNIIRKHFMTTLDLTVTREDALQEAKNVAMAQFAQYGMSSVGDEMLTNYASSMLENKEESKRIYEQLLDARVIDAVAGLVAVEPKTISADEYGKIVEQHGAGA